MPSVVLDPVAARSSVVGLLNYNSLNFIQELFILLGDGEYCMFFSHDAPVVEVYLVEADAPTYLP